MIPEPYKKGTFSNNIYIANQLVMAPEKANRPQYITAFKFNKYPNKKRIIEKKLVKNVLLIIDVLPYLVFPFILKNCLENIGFVGTCWYII